MGLETKVQNNLGLFEEFPTTDTKRFPSENKSFLSDYKNPLMLLLAGATVDIISTIAVTKGHLTTNESNPFASYLMQNFGIYSGLIAQKLAFLTLYPAIINKIIKKPINKERLMYYAGYTQLGVVGLNLIEFIRYGGIRL